MRVSTPLRNLIPSRGPLGLALASLVVFTALAVGLKLALARSVAPSILLVAPEQPWCTQAGFGPGQGEALATLVMDHLEILGEQPVALAESLPEGPLLASLHPHTLVVDLRPVRLGNQLGLGFRRAWSEELQREPIAAWREESLPAQLPPLAFQTFLKRLSLPENPRVGSALIPPKADQFWDLLQGQAWRRLSARMPDAQALASRIVSEAPGCASALLLEGDILYRRLVDDRRVGVQDLGQAEASLQRVQSLVPGHPRGTLIRTQLWADLGSHRPALEALVEPLRERPHSVNLHAALAYVGRTSGLLDLAQRALKQRVQLAPGSRRMVQPDNTHLYRGDLDAFAATLIERPGSPRNVMVRFYRGYLALIRGDQPLAHENFALAAAGAEGFEGFAALARVYQHHLEGRRAEALALLESLEQSRMGLRAPDGEYTFKLAEALAFMGRHEAALDALQRAFAQGFGCTPWYEGSPLLKPLHPLPRWQGLSQHLHERQILLETRFPASRFGL